MIKRIQKQGGISWTMKIPTFLIIMFTLVSCNTTEETTQKPSITNSTETKIENTTVTKEKLQVTTSIVPLASIVNYVGGEYVDATSLVPAGVSPHGFDIKPNQMLDIEKSDLIIHLDMEHVDGFLHKAIENKNNVIAVNSGIELLEASEHDHHDHEDEHGDEDEHHDKNDEHMDDHNEEDEHHDEHEDEEHNNEKAHSIDPHIWGNAENAYIIAKTIVDILSTLSPNNKTSFEANLESFKNELETAKKDFEEKTKNKQQGSFIVFHDAYTYLFKELHIDETKKYVFRESVLSDPNSNDMKNIIDEIHHEGINIAFREPQLDSSNLKTVSDEYNLEILILDPQGTDESKMGYIDNYKSNLKNLLKIYE